MNELTLEILDEAIYKIRAFEVDNEIIGFKIHPADLRCIKEKTTVVWVITNNKFMVYPSYQGFIFETDINLVRGEIKAIRKSTQQE